VTRRQEELKKGSSVSLPTPCLRCDHEPLKLINGSSIIIQGRYLVIEGKVSDIQFTGGFVDSREVPGYASIRRYRKAVIRLLVDVIIIFSTARNYIIPVEERLIGWNEH